MAARDDEAEIAAKFKALEAEVKAKSDADRARKEAAMAKIRERRAAEQAERDALRARQAKLHSKSSSHDDEAEDEPPTKSRGDFGSMLELAGKANAAKEELTKPGEKSWVRGGLYGVIPLGWFYSGSYLEAAAGSLLYLAAAYVLQILPVFFLMPIMMITVPASMIVGVMYTLKYNKTGKRQRMFRGVFSGKKVEAAKPQKALPASQPKRKR